MWRAAQLARPGRELAGSLGPSRLPTGVLDGGLSLPLDAPSANLETTATVMSDDDFVRLLQRTFGLGENGFAERDTEENVHKLAALAGVTVASVHVNRSPRLLAHAVAHRG